MLTQSEGATDVAHEEQFFARESTGEAKRGRRGKGMTAKGQCLHLEGYLFVEAREEGGGIKVVVVVVVVTMVFFSGVL